MKEAAELKKMDEADFCELLARSMRSDGLTDSMHALLMAAMYGHCVRYCAAERKWYFWDGVRWVRDDSGKIFALELEYVEAVQRLCCFNSDGGLRDGMVWMRLNRYKFLSPRRALVESAALVQSIQIAPGEFDRDPMALNVENGVLDLETGVLRTAEAGRFLTKCAGAAFASDAPHAEWDRFLDRIMGGNAALVRFLQKAAGWAMTGDMSEQVLFILHGSGANGKSTFINMIAEVLGDYAQSTQVDTFTRKSSQGIPNDLARLRGCRFLSTSEVEEGRGLSEPLVKQVTGQDPVTARFLYGEYFAFIPEFKIFMAVNHKPVLRGGDNGIWRRVRLIPFSVTIPYEERDVHLVDRLRKEKSGILNWMLEGCLLWQKERLGVSDEIRSATEAYRDAMDVTGCFLSEVCAVDAETASASVKAGMLYAAYGDWCLRNGEKADSRAVFSGRIEGMGFVKHRTSEGRFWKGIGLKKVSGER